MELIDSLLRPGAICVKQVARDWKDAVRKGVDFLVADGKANWDYYDAILRNAEEYGPYFVLMPGVALPHARPEEGALATGFSLVTLDTPVEFGSPENDPISILLSFCSADSAAHVETAMVEAVSLFEEQDYVDRITKARKIGEVEKVLRNVRKKTAKQSAVGRVKKLLRFFYGTH